MKATLSQFPVEIQEEIKSTLTCFDSVNISFSNKKFRVSTGLGISSEYQEDFKIVRKNGCFEFNEIKSSKDGQIIQELIKKNLEIKTDNFVLINLNVIG